MSAGVTTGKVEVDGAELYFESRGEGPALLMIQGGGGDAGGYTSLADRLADAYRVITYDRRGNSRSGGRDGDMQIPRQSRDAVRLLNALGMKSAFVFGNSGGAIIALDMTARHPRAVDALVAHEPPVIEILPEADEWRRFFDDIYALYEEQGPDAALEKLRGSARGMADPSEESHPFPDTAERIERNMREFLLPHELLPFVRFIPDVERIRRNGTRVVLGTGRLSEGFYYARTCAVLAEQLDCPLVEFPGHHAGWSDDPDGFAATLREALATLRWSQPAAGVSGFTRRSRSGHRRRRQGPR